MSKKPQEDWRGGEGGMVDNIGGEVGSIPPYPTFIPPGPKKLFYQYFFKLNTSLCISCSLLLILSNNNQYSCVLMQLISSYLPPTDSLLSDSYTKLNKIFSTEKQVKVTSNGSSWNYILRGSGMQLWTKKIHILIVFKCRGASEILTDKQAL